MFLSQLEVVLAVEGLKDHQRMVCKIISFCFSIKLSNNFMPKKRNQNSLIIQTRAEHWHWDKPIRAISGPISPHGSTYRYIILYSVYIYKHVSLSVITYLFVEAENPFDDTEDEISPVPSRDASFVSRMKKFWYDAHKSGSMSSIAFCVELGATGPFACVSITAHAFILSVVYSSPIVLTGTCDYT